MYPIPTLTDSVTLYGDLLENTKEYTPFFLTEDHPSDTASRFTIFPLSADPQRKSYVHRGREQILIPYCIKWSLESIEYQEKK